MISTLSNIKNWSICFAIKFKYKINDNNQYCYRTHTYIATILYIYSTALEKNYFDSNIVLNPYIWRWN